MSDLFDRRLVFVTGKGGVGKTTVAAAIGLTAARMGKRTILCEVARQDRVSRALGREGVGYEEAELAENLWAISIDPQRAMEEYLRYQLRSRTLYRLLVENRIFQYLFAAAPGTRELVTIGKIWELAQLERKWTANTSPYDLVVVDAPATGHGVGLLRAPRTFKDIAKVGPVARQAGQIDRFFRDPKRTAVAVVALPEEMPVNETGDLRRLLTEQMGRDLDLCVANALHPRRFTDSEAERLAALDGSLGAAARAAVEAALSEHGRAKTQRTQLRRLKKLAAGVDVVTLPYLFEPELGLAEFEVLSRELEAAL